MAPIGNITTGVAYQALVMSVLLNAAGTWTLRRNVGGIPHEVPTPNSAHTLVSACHKRRNIRSHRLTTCYGLHHPQDGACQYSAT